MSEFSQAWADAHNFRVSKENQIPRLETNCCASGYAASEPDAKGARHYICARCSKPCDLQAPLNPRRSKPRTGGEGDSESELHDAILAECRKRGWLVIHSRMDRKTSQACGVADFIIFRERMFSPSVILVEAKRRLGKLTTAQAAFKAHAEKLGHFVHVVRTAEEFNSLL